MAKGRVVWGRVGRWGLNCRRRGRFVKHYRKRSGEGEKKKVEAAKIACCSTREENKSATVGEV